MAVETRNSTRIKNGLRPEYPKKPRRYSEESMATRAEHPRGPRAKKPRTPRKRTGRSTTPTGSFFVSCTSTDGYSDVQYFIATPTPRSTATPEPTLKKKVAPKKRATSTRAPRALATPPSTSMKKATPRKRATKTQHPGRSVTRKPAEDQRDWRDETPSRFTPPRDAKYDNPYRVKRKAPPTKGRDRPLRTSVTTVPIGAYAPSLPPARSITALPTPPRTPGRPTTARSTAVRPTTKPTVGDLFGEHPGEETDSEDVDPEAEAANVQAVAKGLKNKVSRVHKAPEDDKLPSTLGRIKPAVAAFKTATVNLAPQEFLELKLAQHVARTEQQASLAEQQANRTEQQAALDEDLRQRELAVSLREQAEALAVERAEEREEMARATALAAQVRQDLVEAELRELRAKVGGEEEVSARQSSGGSYHYFRRFIS